jgi:hypothetical protein
MTLGNALNWLASSAGASVITYLLMNKINWPANVSEYKRYTSIAIAVAIACAAWTLIEFSPWWTIPRPVDAWGWCSAEFAVGFAAYVGASTIHSATTLKAADKENKELDAMMAAANNTGVDPINGGYAQ